MANSSIPHPPLHHQNRTSVYSQYNPYTNGEKESHEYAHAAQVLAAFNQFPIRQVAQYNGYQQNSQSPTYLTHQTSRQMSDPLLQDMQAHSRDLVSTLVPILQTREGDAGTNYDINNCKGVNHISGSMMPLPTEEEFSRLSSPASRSSFSSGSHAPVPTVQTTNLPPVQQPLYQSPVIKQEPPPQSPIKPETPGFQTTFQFVVNENAKEARNTVRKHVMKEFRRRERWEQGQKGVSHGGIEKKSATTKKRRRTKDNSSDSAEQSLAEGPAPAAQPSIPTTTTPIESRRESLANFEEVPSLVQEQSIPISETIISPTIARHADSRRVIARAPPARKRTKPLLPPVFAESTQAQLWGAVSTDYDNAIVELESSAGIAGPYQHDPWATVAVGQVDPFTKLNLDLGPATQSLLHHFAWVMPSLMDSIVTGKTFHRIGWLYSAVAIHDPTPVHVILGYTLGHIASLRGLEEPPQALEHKSKAIKLLHHRMADAEQCYSDGLIGAIVNFAGWELICANPKAYAMHMSGISRIVTARGGMSAFKDKVGLETVIVRLDAIRAYISQSSPRYPAFSSVRELKPVAINIPHNPGVSTWTTGTTQPSYTPWTYIYCEDALTLMNKLEDVLLICRSAATDLSGPVGEPFHKLLIKCVEQLLARPSFLADEEDRKKPTDIYAAYAPSQPSSTALPEVERNRLVKSSFALRLAALTFLDAAICEFFDSPPYPGYHAEQLKRKFLGSKALANDTPWGRSIEMLIAVLLQADRMALERPWRAWYAADALTLTMRIGEWTWEEVGTTLKAWVQNGGLESVQPQIIDVTMESDTTSTPTSSPKQTASGSGNSAAAKAKGFPGGPDLQPEPRSKDVWSLRDVANKFIAEWESSSGKSSPELASMLQPQAGPSTQPPAQPASSSGTQAQAQTQTQTQSQSQPQPQPPQRIFNPTSSTRRQSQQMSHLNVNVGTGTGDSLGNGTSMNVPVSMSGAGGAGAGAVAGSTPSVAATGQVSAPSSDAVGADVGATSAVNGGYGKPNTVSHIIRPW